MRLWVCTLPRPYDASTGEPFLLARHPAHRDEVPCIGVRPKCRLWRLPALVVLRFCRAKRRDQCQRSHSPAKTFFLTFGQAGPRSPCFGDECSPPASPRPRRSGRTKEDCSPSPSPKAVGPSSFIWLPRTLELQSPSRFRLAKSVTHRSAASS